MLGCLVTLLSLLAPKLTPLYVMAQERTFIAVKPDGVQRNLTGEIIKRFEAKGFKLAGLKFMQASEEHLQKHYADLSDKPFFAGLVKYMASGPLVAMVWEGTGVVKTARQMMGETRPADSKPGTIRGDFCIEVGRNIIHGSDSVESANKEISLWFKPEELVSWKQATHDWIYELLEQLKITSCELGLENLNDHMKDKSYVDGYLPSKRDLAVYNAITQPVDKNKYPHVHRWHKHIKVIGAEIEVNLELQDVEKSPVKLIAEDSEVKTYETVLAEIDDCQGDHISSDLPDAIDRNTVTAKELRNISDEKDCDEKVACSNTYAILLEIRPKDEETDLNELEDLVRGISLDGLKWGASQLSPIAYGIYKLSIICTLEDDRSSIQDVLQKLMKYENYVKDVNIAAFNKV